MARAALTTESLGRRLWAENQSLRAALWTLGRRYHARMPQRPDTVSGKPLRHGGAFADCDHPVCVEVHRRCGGGYVPARSIT